MVPCFALLFFALAGVRPRWRYVVPAALSGLVLVAVFAMLSSWLNWGFSLIFSAMLAKEIARRVRSADYRALAASNAARILGRVFARQALLGRTQYKAYMPRTWRYLERNLRDPALAGLAAWFDRYVPAEARA